MPLNKPCLALAIAGLTATTFQTAEAQNAPSPAAAAAQARTTALGRYDHQLLLSKIAVTDLPRSYEFYTKVVGLKLASPQLQPPKAGDPERDFVEYPLNFTGSLADPFFVLTKSKGQVVTREGAGNTVVGFKVPNVQAAVDRAIAAGAQPVGKVLGVGPLNFGTVTDPDGYHIEFVQAPNAP